MPDPLPVWAQQMKDTFRGGSVSQFIISGNAELGFAARSQLAVPGRDFAGSSWQPSNTLYPPIEQQAVLLQDSPAGRALLAFMQGEEARAIIRAYGYDSP